MYDGHQCITYTDKFIIDQEEKKKKHTNACMDAQSHELE